MKYICRMWTKTQSGWTSEFEEFKTLEEAINMGEAHKRLIKRDELARTYEVYEKVDVYMKK